MFDGVCMCWGILGLLGWLWLGAGLKSGKSLTALHVFHQPCRNCRGPSGSKLSSFPLEGVWRFKAPVEINLKLLFEGYMGSTSRMSCSIATHASTSMTTSLIWTVVW